MASGGSSSSAMSGNTNDEDSAVSMLEVLQEQAELEADAEAVLGDSDATNCTYMLVGFKDTSLCLQSSVFIVFTTSGFRLQSRDHCYHSLRKLLK